MNATTAYGILVFIHVAFGSVALLTFWAAAIARKGSPFHKAVGKGYLIGMLGIVSTAVPMAIIFLARGRTGTGVFFAYLVVITGTSMWLSWRAIKRKQQIHAYFDRRYQLVAWANLLAGVVVFAIGIALGSALLSTFCWIGIVLGINMLRQLRKLPTARNWWLHEHYSAMLGNGVATHVAFLGIGMGSFLNSFGIAWLQLLPWLGPVAVALVAGRMLNRRYAPKPSRQPVVAASV